MASIIGHAAAAVAICSALRPAPAMPRRYWWLAAVAGVLPDFDVVGPLFGGTMLAALGDHRGLTHSLAFAALGAVGLSALAMARAPRGPQRQLVMWFRAWLAFALATASHAGLDSLTKYGDGVAILAPFDWTPVTAPWHVLGSPALAQGRGPVARSLLLFGNEAVWVWVPALVLGTGAAFMCRRRSGPRAVEAHGHGSLGASGSDQFGEEST